LTSFYDVKTRKSLQDAKSKIQAITTVYNMELSKLSQGELIYADVLTKYSQLLIMEALSNGSIKAIMTDESRLRINSEIIRYVKSKYKIDIPLENADVAIEGAKDRSHRVFELMDRYKNAIREAYLQFDTKLRYCSNCEGFTHINHTIKENQYMNMIVDGIYASSEYEDMMANFGKLLTKDMVDRDRILIYSDNPFAKKQDAKTKIQLKGPVYLYSVDAKAFMPSVCLELIHGSRQDGSDIFFPDLRFDGEWVTKEKEVPCECEVLDYIPVSFLKSYQVLYSKGKVAIDAKDKNRIEYERYVGELVKKGKLHSINEEYGINAVI
jgi:hypothetical protein